MNSTLSSTYVAILQIASQYSFYISYITFSAGIVGNGINIIVFTHLKFLRGNRCIFYLTIESIFALVYQIFSIILNILISVYGNDITRNTLIVCKLSYIFSQACSLIIFSMIYFAAADQFFSTNSRYNLRQICTIRLARYLVIIITVLWISHSLLFSFFVNIIPSVGCTISDPNWIRYVTSFFYPILAGFLPIAIASSFSLLAFRNVRHLVRRQVPIVRRRLDRQITAMVLLHVVFYVIFTLPSLIFHMYVLNNTTIPVSSMQFAIVQLIQVILPSIFNLNYSVRFAFCFIYIWCIDLS